MSRFENTQTGVVVSVDDSKDERFSSGLWKTAEAAGKKSASKSDK